VKPKALVLCAAGTNCDRETVYALYLAGADPIRARTGTLRDSPLWEEVQILVIPGGFSYGDDLSAGKVWAQELRLRLRDGLERFHRRGGLILGICNGFQVLVKAGVLPGDDFLGEQRSCTLALNDSRRFECRWVELRADPHAPCVFTRGIERLELPVAHGEGKFVVSDPSTLDDLERRHQFALCYAREGAVGAGYPYNPNGSVRDVAGLTDRSGRILGLMPHPERFVDRFQHPCWSRKPLDLQAEGVKIFKNAVDYFR
jgi:phosphoribosylformylglycinamidine synthase